MGTGNHWDLLAAQPTPSFSIRSMTGTCWWRHIPVMSTNQPMAARTGLRARSPILFLLFT
jgi:hypothetical protein